MPVTRITTLTGSVYELVRHEAPGDVIGTLRRLPAQVPAADGGDPTAPMRRDGDAVDSRL